MNKIYGVSKKQRIPVIFDPILTEDGQYNVYNDDGYNLLSIENYKYIKTHPISCDYVLIKSDGRSGLSLEEQYNKFVKDADLMKTLTGGQVNLYKSGRNPTTALKLIYEHLNELNIVAEEITEKEAEWLENASLGAMVFAEKYEGPAWKYDINSFYPDIYSNKSFNVPIKQGRFLKISKTFFNQMRGVHKIGIYRAIVTYPDDDEKWHKLFKLNPNDFYTYHELRYAHKLNLEIELIVDGDDNFLYYGDKGVCVKGDKFFGKFVKLLYPLKSKCARAKQLLNCLWGCLSQSFNVIVKVDDDGYDIWNADNILSKMELQADDTYKLTLTKKSKRFETNYARIKPFVLSKARVRIAQLFEDHVEHVKRCHTDSVVSDIELPYQISRELGAFKLEEVGTCIIKNCNSCKFE